MTKPDDYNVRIDMVSEQLRNDDRMLISITTFTIYESPLMCNILRFSRRDVYDDFLKESCRRKSIGNFFKKIFCNHRYSVAANSHGDIINDLGGKRTYIICLKCGKGKWVDHYIEAPYGYSYAGIQKKVIN